MEATSSRLQSPGDRGRVASMLVPRGGGQPKCVTFTYRVDGGEMTSMAIYKKPVTQSDNTTLVDVDDLDTAQLIMEQQGDNDPRWRQASYELTSDDAYQVRKYVSII